MQQVYHESFLTEIWKMEKKVNGFIAHLRRPIDQNKKNSELFIDYIAYILRGTDEIGIDCIINSSPLDIFFGFSLPLKNTPTC